MVSVVLCVSAGRDPRAMDARGPVTAQRVPMAGGMQGPVPHSMGPNVPPPARPVTPASDVFFCFAAWLAIFVLAYRFWDISPIKFNL